MSYVAGGQAALCALGLEKTAVVAGAVKAYRRAAAMLRSGDWAYHGTPTPQTLLQSAQVAPGRANLRSPTGVQESYWSLGAPDRAYSLGSGGVVATPANRILSDRSVAGTVQPRVNVRGETALKSRFETNLDAVPKRSIGDVVTRPDWIQTPNSVPLQRRDVFIAPRDASADTVRQARQSGMRVIPKEQYAAAAGQHAPNSGMAEAWLRPGARTRVANQPTNTSAPMRRGTGIPPPPPPPPRQTPA